MNHLDAPINNTPYSDEELEHFRKLLKEKQKESEEKIDTLKENLDDFYDNDADEYSSLGHHIGDLGSEEEQKETDYILIGREEDKIKQIKAALDRIDKKTYGVCEETGKKIQKERLETIPWTRFSMEAMKGDDTSSHKPKV
ncbi:MAG TPA: TraR/DksA C4-type zinc finger protein [Balneolaceae bacterium]